MKILRRNQYLPITLEHAWEFFSNPGNLKIITPDYMGFEILSPDNTQKMYPGMVIAYRIKPLLNIPMTWVTQITHVKEPYYFVDTQMKGPYKFWHHQHHFKEVENGVEMVDILHYEVPGGPIGKIMENMMIEKKVEEIFNYRFKKLESFFDGNQPL